MTIVCSWCRGEGRAGIVGEKAPLDDRRETHGICITHRIAEQARWKQVASTLDGQRLVATPDRMSSPTSHLADLWTGFKTLTRKSRQ